MKGKLNIKYLAVIKQSQFEPASDFPRGAAPLLVEAQDDFHLQLLRADDNGVPF